MAWSFVGSTNTVPAGGGSTSWTIAVPSGVQNGDFLVLVTSGYNSGTAYTPPSGWTTAQNSPGQGSARHSFFVAWRVASSEPASYTVTSNGSSWPLTIMYAIRGGATSSPVLGSAEKTSSSAVTSLAAPSYTEQNASSLLIYGWGGVNSGASGATGLSLPSPSNLLSGSSVTVTDTADGNAYGILACTSSTVPANATTSVSVDETNFVIELAAGGTSVALAGSGTGSDALAVSIPLAESGAGRDSAATTAAIPLAESGAGSDSVAVAVYLADSGAGSDIVSVSGSNTPQLPDSGTGSDALVTGIPLAESGAGSDALSVGIPQAEPGTGSDALAVSIPLAESGAGTSMLSTTAVVTLAESGAGVDALAVSQPFADSGAGSDYLSVTIPLKDSAAGSDALITAAAVPLRESGTGTDYLSVLSPYFTVTAAQAASIAAGDTFAWSGQPGTVFTVLHVAPAGADANVYFTPSASITSGTVTSLSAPLLPNGQPPSFLLDYEHIWQVREDGVPRFEFLGETITEQLVDPSEQRIATVTGPGTLQVLNWAAVMPPGFPDVVFKLDALTDSFSEVDSSGNYVLDTGLWNASSASGVTINPAGSARVTAVPGTTFLGSTAYDATESLISAQVSPIVSPDPAGNTLDNSQLTQFYIQDIASGYYMLMGLSASSFYAKYYGPSGTFTYIIADIGTFSSAASGTGAYAYWQISESDGWFYVWTSSDGQIWAKQYAVKHTGWNPVRVAFYFSAAYDVAGTEYATISSINSNVSASGLAGPAYYNEPIMATWLDQLSQAQARGTVPFVTTGQLSAANDSFGNAWTDSQSVQLQNGTDLLALLQAHAGMINADYIMLPGFRLQVGVPSAAGKITLGYDRSEQVIFHEGHGVMVKTRTRQRNQIQNIIAAINTDGRVATAQNLNSASQWGRREGWVQAAVQVTEEDVAIVAEAASEEAANEVLSYTLQILPGMPGRRIFSDFLVGDWIGLERPDFSAVDAVRVIAIAVQVNDDGSQVHELTLVSYSQWLQEQLTYIMNKMGGGFLNAAGTTAITSSLFNQQAPTVFSPTLAGLSDVAAAAPYGNAPLVYNPVTGKWTPAGQSVSLVLSGAGGVTVLNGDGSGITVNGTNLSVSISDAASAASAAQAAANNAQATANNAQYGVNVLSGSATTTVGLPNGVISGSSGNPSITGYVIQTSGVQGQNISGSSVAQHTHSYGHIHAGGSYAVTDGKHSHNLPTA